VWVMHDVRPSRVDGWETTTRIGVARTSSRSSIRARRRARSPCVSICLSVRLCRVMASSNERAPSTMMSAWMRRPVGPMDNAGGAGRARRTTRRALASASAAMANDSTSTSSASTSGGTTAMVTEPKTGLRVPAEMTMRRAALALAGLGVRVKRIAGLGVKVYACGFYVDAGAMRGMKADGTMGADAFEALSRCERSVRLVFARDVGGDKIVEALAERIRPKMSAGSASLKTFEAIFDGVSFKKGTSLDFSASSRGELSTSIKGKTVSIIDDATLTRALFDAYVGSDPVIPALKAEVAAFISKI
jgi:hypothetical protein